MHRILAFLASLALTIAAHAQVWSLQPSAWANLVKDTDYTAAQLGVSQITGNSALGAAAKATFYQWGTAGLNGLAEPPGGQYEPGAPSSGAVVLANGQTFRAIPTTDGQVFGGTSGSYTGFGCFTFDIMFACPDPAGLSHTNESNIGELTVGAASAFRAQFYVVNDTTAGEKQRCGIKMYATPSNTSTTPATSAQRINGVNPGNTLEPDFEFNVPVTVTLQVIAGDATTGAYRIWLNKTLHSNFVGYDTNAHATTGGGANLGAAGNTFTINCYTGNGYSSGPAIKMCLLPRARIDNSPGWFSALRAPTPATNTGTTRVFPTAFTRMATEQEGHPLLFTAVNGSPAVTPTIYAATGSSPFRTRYVFSAGGAGDAARVTAAEPLGNLETDKWGNQFAGWSSEYVPSGSTAVWGIRSGGDTSPYAVAVNYSGGVVREGPTVGSGAILCALDTAKVYGVVFCGNTVTGNTKVTFVNLSDEYNRVRLLTTVALSTPWPALPLGCMSASYTFGTANPEPSTMLAGRTWGLAMGDSFFTTYTTGRGQIVLFVTGGSGTPAGTVTEALSGATGTVASTNISGASGTVTINLTGGPFYGNQALTFGTSGTNWVGGGSYTYNNTLVCTRNNIGQHVAYGSELHMVPSAWRPCKPVNPSIPDCTYQWSIGRSGRAIEQSDSTTAELGRISGACVFDPCHGVNSTTGVTVSTWESMLAVWGVKMRAARDAVTAGTNTFIYVSPVVKTAAREQYAQPGADAFLSRCLGEATRDYAQRTGDFWYANLYPESFACFVGSADDIHVSSNTDGARYFVGRVFGNPYANKNTSALIKR